MFRGEMKINLQLFVISSFLLVSCDNNSMRDEGAKSKNDSLSKFTKNIKENVVYVQGGKFQMGDFGIEHLDEHLPIDSNSDSKPLHEVELSSYSIAKFKTTNEQFQYYLRYENLTLRKAGDIINQKGWDGLNKINNMPAHADWTEAEQYCSWLAKVTKLPFSLATEAQWEYAARSRGKFLVVGTNDGTWKVDKDGRGINFSTLIDRKLWAEKNDISLKTLTALPVGIYPPNQLGIYDMSGNGYEWVKDWYDPNYYKYSSMKDPQGPEESKYKNFEGKAMKVARGISYSDPGKGTTITRKSRTIDNNGHLPISYTIRCVVNSPYPVQ